MARTFEHDGCEWFVNDTRGYTDAGPSCDDCGACECEPCAACKGTHENCDDWQDDRECIGLSVAYVCLDGGEALCEDCARKAGLPV